MLKWVKLWREESGSFAVLPLVARALFCEALKLTDDDGRIYVGDREPWKAIAIALGADRSDRAMLRKHLPFLQEDGCLVHDGDWLCVPGWEKFQHGKPRSGAPGARPWLKLWRRESGSFAVLPLVARGLFAEALKLTDEDGRIYIGDSEPAKIIARRLGATDRSDRAMLRKHLPLLLEDGCLTHEGSWLRVPGWERFQDAPAKITGAEDVLEEGPPPSVTQAELAQGSGEDSAELAQCSGSGPAELAQRSGTVPARFEQGSGKVRQPKCPESHSRALRPRIRPRERVKNTPQTPRRGAVRMSSLSGLPDPLGELESISSEEFVTRAFIAAGREIGMAPPPRRPQDRARAQELERWALELAPRVAQSRGMDVEAAFCKLLKVAFDLHKEAYCEAEKARRAGKPARAIEWRLGWVASRWERYTQRAVAS